MNYVCHHWVYSSRIPPCTTNMFDNHVHCVLLTTTINGITDGQGKRGIYIYNGIVFSCKETTISYEMEVAGNNHSE